MPFIFSNKRNSCIKGTLLLSLIFATSCSYIPTLHNTPMLTRAGEVQASFMFENFVMYDLQAAGGISNNIGLMVNTRHSYLMFDDIKSSLLSAEAGLGFYSPSGFEVYGGGGMGWYKPIDESIDGSGRLKTFFVQPAYGVRHRSNSFFRADAQSIFALRLSGINDYEKTLMFIEPGIVLKSGVKWVNLVSNFGCSVYLGNRKELKWNHNPLFFGFGVQVSIGRK